MSIEKIEFHDFGCPNTNMIPRLVEFGLWLGEDNKVSLKLNHKGPHFESTATRILYNAFERATK